MNIVSKMWSAAQLLLLACLVHLVAPQGHPNLPPFINEIIDDVEDESPKVYPEIDLSKKTTNATHPQLITDNINRHSSPDSSPRPPRQLRFHYRRLWPRWMCFSESPDGESLDKRPPARSWPSPNDRPLNPRPCHLHPPPRDPLEPRD